MCDFVRVPFSYSPVLDSRFEHESGSGDRTFESQMKDSLVSGKGEQIVSFIRPFHISAMKDFVFPLKYFHSWLTDPICVYLIIQVSFSDN